MILFYSRKHGICRPDLAQLVTSDNIWQVLCCHYGKLFHIDALMHRTYRVLLVLHFLYFDLLSINKKSSYNILYIYSTCSTVCDML